MSTDRGRTPRSGNRALLALSHSAAWLYAAALLLPLYYLIVSSFKYNLSVLDTPFALPTSVTLGNFAKAFDDAQLGPGLANSALVALGAAALTIVLAVPAAYGIVTSPGRLGQVLEGIFSAGFLIPGFAALVPTVLLAIALNQFQTRQFLVAFLPSTALPLSVVLLVQFMRAIPRELEESAAMDGASRLKILTAIYLPLVMPGVVTVTILNLINFWNEYLFALILNGPDPEIRTAQVALPTLISATSTDYAVLAAGVLITLLPIYLAYAVASRRMEQALLQGALKG